MKVLIFAERFNKLAEFQKKAGILENMAARVMWSTIPHDKQLDNIIALESLVPGARELLRYGLEATDSELKHVTPPQMDLGVEKYYKSNKEKDPVGYLKYANYIFEEGKSKADYGGKPWATITKALKELAETLVKLDSGVKRGHPEYIPTLQMMTAAMNLVDGTVHNTGSLLDKLLDIEADEKSEKIPNYEDTLERRTQMFDAVQKIMDAKELDDPKDVISIVLPVIRTVPEKFMPFKDWAGQFKRTPHQPEKPVDIQLKKVRAHKLLNEAYNWLKKSREYKPPSWMEDLTETGMPKPHESAFFVAIDLSNQTAQEIEEKNISKEISNMHNSLSVSKIKIDSDFKLTNKNYTWLQNLLDTLKQKIDAM